MIYYDWSCYLLTLKKFNQLFLFEKKPLKMTTGVFDTDLSQAGCTMGLFLIFNISEYLLSYY